jgi:hypothetical protein
MGIEMGVVGTDEPMSPADWVKAQRQIMLQPAVIDETLSQLSQRGQRPFESPDALKTHLDATLRVSSNAPGKLTLEYRNTDPEVVWLMLESLGRAYLGYQMVEDRKADRPSTITIKPNAARDPTPAEDRRLIVGAQVFAGAVLGSLVLFFVLRFWLLRASRVFDGEEKQLMDQLDDPKNWPAAGGASNAGKAPSPGEG